jgi:hypothetical protein
MSTQKRHAKCKGYFDYWGESDCGYYTTINCDECRYLLANKGVGKNPEAICNQPKHKKVKKV